MRPRDSGTCLSCSARGAQLSDPLVAAGWHLVLHRRQLRLQMLGLETAPGVGAQAPHEQPLGFVVLDVVIPRSACPSRRSIPVLPAGSGVNGAAELLGIDDVLATSTGCPDSRCQSALSRSKASLSTRQPRLGTVRCGRSRKRELFHHQRQAPPLSRSLVQPIHLSRRRQAFLLPRKTPALPPTAPAHRPPRRKLLSHRTYHAQERCLLAIETGRAAGPARQDALELHRATAAALQSRGILGISHAPSPKSFGAGCPGQNHFLLKFKELAEAMKPPGVEAG